VLLPLTDTPSSRFCLRFLGLTVGAVQSNIAIEAAQAAYGCHVTYVTGQELCFNYLKDNTAQTASELVSPRGAGPWRCLCLV
jgi:preprotein translocase subunit SecA